MNTHHADITATPGRRAEMLADWIREHGSETTGIIVEQVARYRAELAELLPTIAPDDPLGLELLAALELLSFDSIDDLATWKRITGTHHADDIRAAFRVEWKDGARGRELLGRLLKGLDK